jgi:GH24 family phage-related lysozyme (muramidase)
MYEGPTEGGYQAVKEFIKNQEGFAKKAAWDFKQFTNGYGTKAKSANEMISKEEADRRMDAYLMPTMDRIQSALKVPASNGQLTALASMAYNGGYGVVKKIINQMNNQVDPQEIANTIKRTAITVNNGEQVLPQLIKRRKKEATQFLQGYKVGGQYDISNDEIKRLMRQGYDLELI